MARDDTVRRIMLNPSAVDPTMPKGFPQARRYAIFAPMFSLFTIIALLGAAPSPAQVAFLSGTCPADLCVYVHDAATGQNARVGRGQADGAPVWSPDGAWIAFETFEGARRVIALVRPDGTDARLLPCASDWNTHPAWAPGSNALVYIAGALESARPVVFDLDTGTETSWGGEQRGLIQAVWAGKDSLLAVGLQPSKGRLATEVFQVSETAVVPLLRGLVSSKSRYAIHAIEAKPGLDGLCFESNDGGDREIYAVLSARRRGLIDVSNHRAADWNPRWAPNGKWIAFESFRGGRRGVYRVNVDTVLVQPVCVGPNFDAWAPSWSSKGDRLAYVSTESGAPLVYTSDARGGQKSAGIGAGALNDAPAIRPEKGGRK